MAYGELTWKDNDDPGGIGVGNNCGVDPYKKVMFLCHEAGGLDSYTYTTGGILTHRDNQYRSGLSLGVAVDYTRMLVFEAANIKIGLQPRGTVQSYSYDAVGNLTFLNWSDANPPMIWFPYAVAKGIDIDIDHRLIFVAVSSTRGLYVFSYDNAGNLTFPGFGSQDNPGGDAYGVCVDTLNHIVFLATQTDGVHTYKYDAAGNLTHVDHDDQGGTAQGGTVDTTHKLLFLLNGDRCLDVYSYDVNGNLTWLANYDTPLGSGRYGISIDTYSHIIFLALDQIGIYTYNYTDAGICTYVDDDDQGGVAYGAYADTVNHIVFLANWDRGVEAYSYLFLAPPIPTPILITDSWGGLSRTTDRFLMKPNWLNAQANNFDFNREITEFVNTVSEIYRLGQDAAFNLTYRFTNLTRADEHYITSFFTNHRGKHKRFWIPLWKNMYTLSSSISTGDGIISIRNVGFHLVDRGYERIFIELKNGYQISRKVTAVLQNGLTEDLILDGTIDRDITQDDIKYFSRLLLVRFTDDSLELKYSTDSTSSIELSFLELTNEYELESES